jgi:GMP synthase (glutamine-hydrolysing)
MRLHVFQHVPHERPANIALWAKARGHTVETICAPLAKAFPMPDAYDALIILGGPMGVYEEPQYPWMTEEKNAIRAAIDAQKKVLGICLGSQLIASVLGAKVYKHSAREIGWFPVHYTAAAKTLPHFAHFPESFLTFHWHGDTFDLPAGAVLLATNEATRNQAFAYRDHVVAIQFHPEIAQCDIEAWLAATPPDRLAAERYVQPPEILLSGSLRHLAEAKTQFDRFLDSWLR